MKKKLLNKYLIENNLRQTPERYIVLKYIYKISNHFDIDFLYGFINKKEKKSAERRFIIILKSLQKPIS